MTLSAQMARAIANTRYARKSGDSARIADAQRDIAEAKITSAIQRVVDAAPPLYPEQRERLATIIRTAAPKATTR
ncbi:hypothetical protein [Microbacterium xylanilyticum]